VDRGKYTSVNAASSNASEEGELALTSLKRKRVITNESTQKLDVAMQGRKYGYCAQKGWLKYVGKRSCGRDKLPPRNGLDAGEALAPQSLLDTHNGMVELLRQ